MQFALVEGLRREPFKGGKGICSGCGSALIAKCGDRVMHHWAHAAKRNCDPWWENETAWHRSWKNLFPESWREVLHVAPDGEFHRADIKTESGIVIEVQHSAISDTECTSREQFYRNLVWIVDGSTFLQNFHVCHILPDPEVDLARDICWVKAQSRFRGTTKGMFFRYSEGYIVGSNALCKVHSMEEIRREVESAYLGHHQYYWSRPRGVWLSAACPVFIDFGNNTLAKLEIYDKSGLPCIRYVSSKQFVRDAMVSALSSEIATLSRQ